MAAELWRCWAVLCSQFAIAVARFLDSMDGPHDSSAADTTSSGVLQRGPPQPAACAPPQQQPPPLSVAAPPPQLQPPTPPHLTASSSQELLPLPPPQHPPNLAGTGAPSGPAPPRHGSADAAATACVHPAAGLFSLLLDAAAAADSIRLWPSPDSAQGGIPAACNQELPEHVSSTFMAAAAREYHASNTAVPPAARSYVTALPCAELLAPAAQAMLTAAGCGAAVVVDVGTAEGYAALEAAISGSSSTAAQLEPPAPALLLHAAAFTEVAALLRVSWQGPQPDGGTVQFVLLDPSGAYSELYDMLPAGPAYLRPGAATLSSKTQRVPGTSSCHLLLALLGYGSGHLLDFSSCAALDCSYQALFAHQVDADYAVSCVAQLLLEGRASIGLLGVRLRGDEAADSRSNADAATDQLLGAWVQQVSSQGRGSHGSSVTWEDVHNLSDVLHNLDGYVTPDGHRLFVSCSNSRVRSFHQASADVSLPFYGRQELRWMQGSEAAPGDCSELVLHYSGTHYTLSIINHQHSLLLYFDSLGGRSPQLAAPEGYATVVLSKGIQAAATCGPHALFVAMAYAADLCGLRSSCGMPHEAAQAAGALPAPGSGGGGSASAGGAAAHSSGDSVSDTASTQANKKRRRSSKKQKGKAEAKRGRRHVTPEPEPPPGQGLSRAAGLEQALAACYGDSLSHNSADALVSAAYRVASAASQPPAL